MFLYDKEFADQDNFFAELTNSSRKIIVRIDVKGNTEFFAKMQ